MGGTAGSRSAAARRRTPCSSSRSATRRRRRSGAGRRTSCDELAALAGDALRPTGSLRLAVDDEERDELREEYEALVGAGFAAEWREDLPPPLAGRYPAALFHPPDGVLQPARLVRGLARRAAEAGVEIHEHTRVGVGRRSRRADWSSSRRTATRAACSASSKGSSSRRADR